MSNSLLVIGILNDLIDDLFRSLPKFKQKNYLFSNSNSHIDNETSKLHCNTTTTTTVSTTTISLTNNNGIVTTTTTLTKSEEQEEILEDDKEEDEEMFSVKYKPNRIIYNEFLKNDDTQRNKSVIYVQKQEIYKEKSNLKETSEHILHHSHEESEDEEENDCLKQTVYTWQMNTLKQRKNDSCGYYSLYNSMMILNSFCMDCKEESRELFDMMQCKSTFWYTYHLVMRLLLDYSKSLKPKYNGYPWNEKYIYNGVLERPYIDYLFSNDNIISRQQYPITILPDWSVQSLKNNRLPLEEINEMHKISERFRQFDEYSHVFIIGQAVHWLTIVVNKLGSESEIIVMDSRNYDLLGSTEEQFEAKVNSYPDLPDRLKRAYLYSLREPKIIVNILRDCMIGGKDITKVLLELNLTGFLENFYSHVNLTLKNTRSTRHFITSNGLKLSSSPSSPHSSSIQDPTEHDKLDEISKVKLHKEQLLFWLENYYPPSVIEYTICQVLDTIITKQEHIHKYLETRTLELLSNWINDTLLHIKNHHSDGHTTNNNNNSNNSSIDKKSQLIQRFSLTMNWFSQKFI
ncbi:hypothetical protein DLAC_00196 [Tieghemostelium lacteum]|uniref:Uncharacterized protein n=1 Tax=Tieghemostelium lacteum TaxID=361077 RepID=A0A152A9C5_TIELA|nr:hypothetical protein DLAC_00196 [Tieghemostelium lacteum]|eukprot:KYR02731.1 hypothetical protein DLAC_00196 [Tieghemostelium lacteum]